MAAILTILFVILLFCLIAGFIAGLGVGIGFLLAACVSSLETGYAIVAGSVIAVASTYFSLKLLFAVTEKDNEGDCPVCNSN